VKIRKTTRPQSGKPSYLREARQAVESLVLLDWGCIRNRQIVLVPDPDEVARKKQEEEHKRTLERNRRLEWELERAQEESANLRKEVALARDQEHLAPTGSPHDTSAAAKDSLPAGMTLAEWRAIGPPGAEQGQDINPPATSGGPPSFAAEVSGGGDLLDAKDSRPRAQSPSEGLASRQREADGLAFLEEVKQLIASIEPINTSDHSYREMLKKLYEVMRNNYRHHGVIPERQHLPTLRGVRSGVPFSISIPDWLYKMDKNFDQKEYFRKYLGIE
jgi:hypothetical protein